MRIDRMLAITVMLLNRDRISARELAEKFEVSVRTIYRDIDAINLAGIPVVSYPGNDGGFGIMENYKIDRQLLTLNDMLTILSALKGINTGLKNSEVENAIEKISNLVPKEKAEEMELFFRQMVIDIAPYGHSEKYKNNLKVIQRSIADNKLLRIIYTNIKGEKLERIIEPMTLIMRGYIWYLFAFCRERNNFRIFRLSRIKNIQVLEQNFTRKDQSHEKYINQKDETQPETPIVLKFSPAARVKVEDYFEEEQIEILENGDMIVRVSYPEDEWVYSFILSYGESVEVLEPPHIKKIIRDKIKMVLEKYKKTE
ncbi:MAG: YafY family transcriptional regulator [Spirochaetes bacterium]|nr:YafY family transcriptional regulator [Spirochaetota bacterium]